MDVQNERLENVLSQAKEKAEPVQQLWVDASFFKKVGAAALIIMLVVSAFGGLIVMQTDNILTSETKEEIRSGAKSQATQTNIWMTGMYRQTIFLSETQAATGGDTKGINTYLDSKTQELPSEMVAVHVVNTNDGTIIGSTSNDRTGENIVKQLPVSEVSMDSLGLVAHDKVYLTNTFSSPASRTEAIALVSPVQGTDRAVVSVIDLGKASLQLNPPANGRSVVMNMDGKILLSSNPKDIGENAFDLGYVNDKAWQKATSEKSAMYQTAQYTDNIQYKNEQQLTGFVTISKHKWVSMTQTNANGAFYLRQTITSLILALIGVIFLTTGAVAGVIGVDTRRTLNRLRRDASEVANGNLDHDIAVNRDDEFGDVFKSVNQMSNSLQTRINEVEELNSNITDIVARQSGVLGAVAAGDLTARMRTDSGIEQLDQLAEDFNNMVGEVQDSIEEAKKFGHSVATASEEATSATDDIRRASAEVTSGTQEISSGATKQNENLDQTVSEMNELSATIQQVAASADQLAEQAEVARDTSEDGLEAAAEASEVLDTIEEETEDAVETVEELSRDMEEISEIVEFISKVAKQTNMLAINAGIEAARAGEAGEGFAVVADEVKALADDVSEAAEDIEENLNNLQKKTHNTADDMESAKATVDRGAETIEDAFDALNDINDAVEETAEGVKEIDRATEQQSETAQEVVTKVDSVATISEETASQSEDVAAAAEEQTASIEQVSRSVGDLAEQSVKLSDMLDHFEAGLDLESVSIEEYDAENIDLEELGLSDEDVAEFQNDN